jgi:amino acid permease
MERLRLIAGPAGFLAATTIGAGMFALPAVFLRAGWGMGMLYLIVLGVLMAASHLIYWKTLDVQGGSGGIVGLARRLYGPVGYGAAFLAVVGGLLLALVVYLILGVEFIRLIVPNADYLPMLLFFWVVSSLPLLGSARRLYRVELIGAAFLGAIIVLIFFTAEWTRGFGQAPVFDDRFGFLPFGPVLFSLAAWTAVGPMREQERLSGEKSVASPAILWGTAVSAALYALFVLGIFGSAAAITEDTISGLSNLPPAKLALLGALGVFALWTSYLPISAEIRNALERDVGLGSAAARALVIALPLALLFFGLSSFLNAVALAGGVFVSLQYLFILALGRRTLPFGLGSRLLLDFLTLVFLLAVVYEFWGLVLQ